MSHIPEKLTLAIIGCGPAGLISGHHALQNGFTITIFEKNPEIAGIWSNFGYSWPHLTTNVTKYSISFLNFQWREYDEIYPSKASMQSFFLEYAQTFDLLPRIQVNTLVKNIQLLQNGKFQLSLQNQLTKDISFQIFDKCVICSGCFAKPEFGNCEKYRNDPSVNLEISHVCQYKSPENYRGKRVLVVGHGHSAVQIASELSKIASSVINIFRESHWILPRWVYSEKYKKILPSDIALFSTKKTRIKLAKLTKNERNHLRNQKRHQIFKQNSTGIEAIYMEIDSENHENVAVCDDYIENIKKGLIKAIKSEIVDIKGKMIYLQNGDIVEIDEIILGFGYTTDFSFLEDQILNKLEYNPTNKRSPLKLEGNNVFNAELKNLAFVGFTPHVYIISSFEFQANVAMNFLKFGEDYEQYKKKFRVIDAEDIDFNDHLAYNEAVAEEAGFLIDFEGIEKEDKELYEMVMDGPYMINHFHLRKENKEKKIWDFNAEIIKKYNRELKRGFFI